MFGILALGLLMVVHEGGHFLAARLFGMRVLKFSIGFGPPFFQIVPEDGRFWLKTAGNRIRLRLWRQRPSRSGDTIYQVAMIPFFAYVQIAGMNPLEETDPNDKRNFGSASLIGRITTIFSGPAFNYVCASVFFFFALLHGGKPGVVMINNEPELAAYVSPLADRPAAKAGILAGDKVVEVSGTAVQTWDQMAAQISKRPGEPIQVTVEREGKRSTIEVTPANDNGKGRIGVAPHKLKVPVGEAAVSSLVEPTKVVQGFFAGLKELFRGKTDGLGGPLRMISETSEAARQGLAEYLYLLGVLSAYIGVFNLLPFPALDGGRLAFLAYEAVTRRKPNAHVEVFTNLFGFFTLIGLAAYVTFFKDIPHMLAK